jgi:hypothetical protein
MTRAFDNVRRNVLTLEKPQDMCDINSFANRFTLSTAITRDAHNLGPRVYLDSQTKIDYHFREVITFLIL